MPLAEHTPYRSLIEAAMPAWLIRAPNNLRQHYFASSVLSLRSSTDALAVTARLQGPAAFCAPLLQAELDRLYPHLKLDVNRHELVRMVRTGDLLQTRLRPHQQTLLEAAMQNFAPGEAMADGFERGSVILPVGVFTFDVNDDLSLRYKYPASKVVPLEPHVFACLCRTLDLGQRYQQHLASVLGIGRHKAPGIDISPQKSRVAVKLHLRDRLEVDAVTARIKGHITASALDLVLQITQPREVGNQPLWDGEPVDLQAVQLLQTAFGGAVMLLGPVLITRKRPNGVDPGKCLVYLPGDPDFPLHEYDSRQDFADSLRERLRDRRYQTFFARFVEHEDAPAFFERLNNTLAPTPASWPLQYTRPPVPDPDADIGLRVRAYAIDLTRLMHKMYTVMIQSNAAIAVVPTARQDDLAREQRLAWWETLGLGALNLAAFVVPGVGEMMAVVGAVQLVKDLCIGVDDWKHGQTEEALAHFGSVAQNLAMVVAGVAGGVALARSPFVENLVPVTDAAGRTRLIHPDLSPYASDLSLPEHAQPNALGQHELDGKYHVVVDDRLYRQAQDPVTGEWTVEHPRLAGQYRPVLQHNGAGAWQHGLEQPQAWEGAALLRRFGPLTDGLTDSELMRLRESCGVSEQRLRALHLDRQGMPGVLEQALIRFRSQRQVDQLIERLNGQQPLGAGGDYAAPLLTRLQRWPREVGVRMELEDGRLVHYQDPAEGDVYVTLKRVPGITPHPADTVLRQLTPSQRAGLFADNVGSAWEAQVTALSEALAEQAARARDEIAAALVARDTPALKPLAQPLQRDFPGLPASMANELAASATATELQRLGEGRVPTRLAEAARWQLRDLRLGQAMEGLINVQRASPDRDLLAFGLLEHLPGWPADLRIELVAELGGQPVAAAGPSGAADIKVVVRRDGRYQPFDAHEQSLAAPGNLFTALHRALPDSARAAMAITGRSGRQLRREVWGLALQDRDRAGLVLGQRRLQPWFNPPWRLGERIGYPLSGRGGPSFTQRWRVRSLFPGVTDAELPALMDWVRSRNANFDLALRGLQQEYQVLERTLREWSLRAPLDEVDHRAQLRNRLVHAWRRGTRRVIVDDLRLGELPVITADFSHVEVLALRNVGLRDDPSHFLRQFPNLTQLGLDANQLEAIPPAIGHMRQLRVLNLQGNQLAVTDTLLQPLVVPGETRPLRELILNHSLRTLMVGDQPRSTELTPQALAPLRQLPELRLLSLSNNAITLEDGAFDVLGDLTSLETLRMRRTWMSFSIRRREALSRLVNLRALDMSENVLLDPPDVSNFRQLQVLGLWTTDISEMPPGLDALLLQRPRHLARVNLGENDITDIGELPDEALREFNGPMDLILDGNPLSMASRNRLRRAGVTVHLPPAPAPVLDTDWLADAPQTLRERVAADRLNPEAESFYRILDQMHRTRDFQRNPQAFQARMWALLEAAVPPVDVGSGDGLGVDDLRQQLFAQAALVAETCGDGVITTLDELETTVLAWQAASLALEGGEAMLAPLTRLARQLFRQALVDERARSISAARERRFESLLLAASPLPELDPLDAIDDAQLLQHQPDEVEIRLWLREQLEQRLNLRPQPGRLYGAAVSQQVAERVGTQVITEDTPQRFADYLAQQPYWENYGQRVHHEAFAQLDQQWDDVLNLFTDATDPDSEFELQGERQLAALLRLEAFTASTAQPIGWRNAAGAAQHVELPEGVVLEVFNWMKTAKAQARHALLRQWALDQAHATAGRA
ncbi:dermonecrotic toxin domain-containing protein [Pseudomonas sp. TE3610]